MTWASKYGSRWRFARLPLVLVVGVSACGGGTTFDGSVVRGPEVSYRIGAPGNHWSKIEVTDNDIAWRSDTRPSSIIQVNGRCDKALDIPLQALRAHLLIGFTERDFRSEERIDLDGREALRSQVSAKLDGVTRELDLVVLKKDGCVYDFSLIAANEPDFGGAQSNFERVLSQFGSEP